MPRFDSPSVFGRILDNEEGGKFVFLYKGEEIEGDLHYIKNTNVLKNRFEKDGNIWEVLDFFPRIPEGMGLKLHKSFIRILRPVQGQPQISVEFDPRPDYARQKDTQERNTDSIYIESNHGTMHLHSNLSLSYIRYDRSFLLDRTYYFIYSHGPNDFSEGAMYKVQNMLDATIYGWRQWAKSCSLPTFAPEAVLRSALCLKLHIFEDTGAILAASTTSIPEAMNTERTWDYRFCWLRDAAFVVEALRRISQVSEGENFLRFLTNIAAEGPLQPLYAIDGERNLEEIMLPHLSGFQGNGNVRIGNAAYVQKQNDLMGEIILSLDSLLRDPRIVFENKEIYFPLIEDLVEQAIVAAPTKDTGIWEYRTIMHNHTFSRAMCWVAAERGAAFAESMGKKEQAKRWKEFADRERDLILERSYNDEKGFFAQILEGDMPDASILLLATIGIVDAKDPRFVSTLKEYEKLLVHKGLMLRYINPDDFGDTTSAFTICSFWWCEALALSGRLDDAVTLFNKLLDYANPLGLFSEDIEPDSGQLLGNFPQAYTHVGLIHAATTIGELLEARDGRVRAWS